MRHGAGVKSYLSNLHCSRNILWMTSASLMPLLTLLQDSSIDISVIRLPTFIANLEGRSTAYGRASIAR